MLQLYIFACNSEGCNNERNGPAKWYARRYTCDSPRPCAHVPFLQTCSWRVLRCQVPGVQNGCDDGGKGSAPAPHQQSAPACSWGGGDDDWGVSNDDWSGGSTTWLKQTDDEELEKLLQSSLTISGSASNASPQPTTTTKTANGKIRPSLVHIPMYLILIADVNLPSQPTRQSPRQLRR